MKHLKAVILISKDNLSHPNVSDGTKKDISEVFLKNIKDGLEKAKKGDYSDFAQEEKRTKNFYLIYEFIKKYNQLPKFDMSDQKRNYYVKQLKKAGFIHKIGYGTWEIIADFDINKIEQLKKSQASTKNYVKLIDCNKARLAEKIRSHAFRFTIRIPNLENWKNRKEFMEKNNIQFKPYTIGSLGQQIFLDGRKIMLTDKSIVIFDKSDYITDSAKEGRSYAISNMHETIAKVENLFNCSFRINKRYLFRVSKQHYSALNCELAKQYRKDGKKVYIYDHKGAWMWFDFSDGIDEREVGDRLDSHIHADNHVTPFFNGLKDPEMIGFTPQHIENTMGQLALSLKKSIELEEYYGEHHKSHIETLRENRIAVQELVYVVKELKETIQPKKSPLQSLLPQIHSLADVFRLKEEITSLSPEDKKTLEAHIFQISNAS